MEYKVIRKENQRLRPMWLKRFLLLLTPETYRPCDSKDDSLTVLQHCRNVAEYIIKCNPSAHLYLVNDEERFEVRNHRGHCFVSFSVV